ncbi:MAG: cupin domain-containing protein [Solirubrobacterales bacterium]
MPRDPMADVTVKRTEDFETYYLGAMAKVRSGLGVSSFGMQLIQMAPNEERYPEHDHSHDGQEEVYVTLEGSATLTAGGEEHGLEPGVWARVGPAEKRKIVSGDDGVRILALGGVPGKVFDPGEATEEGQPDPMAASAE